MAKKGKVKVLLEIYKNVETQQRKGVIEKFDKFFDIEKFDTIIEIGTGNGAFSVYIAEISKKYGWDFYTYDIIDRKNKETTKELNKCGAKVFIQDVDKTDIEGIIKSGKRCLILNDGKVKINDFKRLSPSLKKDDIILSHDYYKNKDNYGPSYMSLNAVQGHIKKHNLKVVYENLFEKHIWLCVKK